MKTNKAAEGVSWLHRFAALVAVTVFAFLLTGALVTFRNGLAVPPWPPLVGADDPAGLTGVEHERLFLIVAVSACILSLVLAVWAWRSDKERHVKALAGLMLVCVLTLPVLSQSRLLSSLPAVHAAVYTSVSQLFFCLAVCLALFTRTDWTWDEFKTPDVSRPALRQLAVCATVMIFCDSPLGVAARSRSVGPHLVGGIAVTACVLWMVEIVFDKLPQTPGLKVAAIVLAEVVVLEMFVGLFAHSMALDAPRGLRPAAGLAVINTTHAAVGALALAASLFLTFQCFRHLESAQERSLSAGEVEIEEPARTEPR